MNDDPILTCEAELRAAMLINDVSALDRLIDDELVFTTLEGAVIGKQWDLDAHRARRLRLTQLEPSDQRVQRWDSMAVVSVRMDVTGTWDGSPANGALRYTRVWCKRPDGWRLVAGHMSAVTA
ncbi:MAG TPA: nuclear transport factor 2 family protein [Gemmatimonadaceae bacterium]|nr:nuclear transport factor 2 family protein [Gemmatimonadaceae bacterium]